MMSARRRVVVTGIGVDTPIGSGKEAFWQACLQGKQSVAPVPAQWPGRASFTSTIWSPLPSDTFKDAPINRAERMQLDPVQILALMSAKAAIDDAGIQTDLIDEKKNTFSLADLSRDRGGVYIGTGNGGLNTYTDSCNFHVLSPVAAQLKSLASDMSAAGIDPAFHERILSLIASLNLPRRLNPFSVAMTMPNACAGSLSLKYALKGPSQTLCAACASGTVAIGAAFADIQSGIVDYALAGGAEYLVEPSGGIFRAFDIAQTLVHAREDITTSYRPFDKGRTGFLFSAGGSAVLVLEEYEQARNRGARCYAEICAYNENTDGSTVMGMDPDGTYIEKMLRDLLKTGGTAAHAVDYINTHGTGTLLNDQTEADIISRVFGRKPLVNSTKSLIGHTIGASGAIEAAVTALSIHSGTTHPSLNLDDPICDLNFVTGKSVSQEINTAISQSFGFGGHNCALLFGKSE